MISDGNGINYNKCMLIIIKKSMQNMEVKRIPPLSLNEVSELARVAVIFRLLKTNHDQYKDTQPLPLHPN